MRYDQKLTSKLIIAIALNSCFTLFEFTIGYTSASLSLLSDACHNLTDVLCLCITLCSYKIAQKKPSASKTYGYGKITIMGALCNGIILVTLACSLFYEAYKRFWYPQSIEGGIVLLVGLAGIFVNGLAALLFLKERHDLALQSAFLNMLFDALASAGALLAGLTILLTGYTYIDTFVSSIIGLFLFISGYRILQETFHLLLEGTPYHIDREKIKQLLATSPGIVHINDLHLWALSCNQTALSCSLIVSEKDMYTCAQLVKNLKTQLYREHPIDHITIEIQPITHTQTASKNSCFVE